jgi:hypothetical protein
MITITLETSMRDRARLLVRQAAVVLSLAALAACTERPRDAVRSTMTAPATGLRSSSGAALVMACPAIPGVSQRAVAAGTRGDANGNGIVCEQHVPSAGRERVLTMDDGLMPQRAAK